MTSTIFRITIAALLIGLFATPAIAQDVGRREVRADARDLRRFEDLLTRFDRALRGRNDAVAIRAVLAEFVQAGRDEVTELQRATQAAQAEAESERGRAGRDDRRDYRAELARLQQAATLVRELEQTAAAEIDFGPRRRILNRAREAMVEFVALARAQLEAAIDEMREDRRDRRRR